MVLRPSGALPALTACFAAGIVAADAGVLPRGPALVAGLHALALAWAWPRARAALALGVALCAGAAALGARLERADRHAPRAPREVLLEATVARSARWGGGHRIALRDAVGVGASRDAVPAAVALRVEPTPEPFAALEAVSPGARVRARVRLRPVHGLCNPGGSDPAVRARRRGVGARGRLVHPALHAVVAPAPPLRAAAHAWRRRAVARLEARGPGGALLAGLGLGAAEGLPRATREALARLGLAHLLAVSGLHLALVAGLAFAAARRAAAAWPGLAARGDPRRVALAVALAAAAAYALGTGLGVPVRRAWLLLLALALAAWRGRPAARAPALASAGLAVLVAEPGALFEAGAQLSFAATAALMAARPVAPGFGTRGGAGTGLREAAAQAAAATAAAMAATAPLAALHFGLAAPAGALANLVAVPIVAFAVLPLALGAAVVALGGEGAAAGALLDGAARACGALLELAQALAARAPAAEHVAPPAWALVLAVGCVPAALRARRVAVRLAAAGAGSVVLALAPAVPWRPAPPRVVVLDVGAGDAILVEGPEGAVLVDGAAAIPHGVDLGAAVVVPALRTLGVRQLDLVVASHADLDHRGGLPAVLAALPVGAVWVPRGSAGDEGFAALRAAAAARGVPVLARGLGDAALRLGGLRVVPLWPPARGAPPGRNDRSLVVRVDAPGARVLLPGDLEAAGEGALRARVPASALRAEVLKLPHHGSATSSTAALLDAVRPRLAVASAPRFPRHPMPAPEVAARVAARGARLLWTGRDGAVLVGLRPGLPVRALRAGAGR